MAESFAAGPPTSSNTIFRKDNDDTQESEGAKMGIVQAELVEKALPGAVDHEDNWVSFALYAPQKKSVHLISSFNDWDRQKDSLEQRDPGYWVTVFQLDSRLSPFHCRSQATGTSLIVGHSRLTAQLTVKSMPLQRSSCFPANPELTERTIRCKIVSRWFCYEQLENDDGCFDMSKHRNLRLSRTFMKLINES